MHPEKSKVVYCRHSRRTGTYPQVQFTFLGFTFRPRRALNKQNRPFTSFLPGVSNAALKRMREAVRGWKLHRQTPASLAELAQQYNPTIRGWWQYEWLSKMRDIFPQMFAHWRFNGGAVG